MSPIRILIADDHPVFRFGLRALLATEPEMAVVGEATTGVEAVTLAESLGPDVVLMDVNLPELNGIDATKRILKRDPAAGVLILTMLDDDSLFAAMQAGARGYVLKGAASEDILQAIQIVARGEAIFSPSVAQRLVLYFARSPAARAGLAVFPDLTTREREVLNLIAQGLTNNAIAERLFLSPKTVRNLVSTIFDKLQVAGRAEAIVAARQAGMG